MKFRLDENYADTFSSVGGAAGTIAGLFEPTPFGEMVGGAVGSIAGRGIGTIADKIADKKKDKDINEGFDDIRNIVFKSLSDIAYDNDVNYDDMIKALNWFIRKFYIEGEDDTNY